MNNLPNSHLRYPQSLIMLKSPRAPFQYLQVSSPSWDTQKQNSPLLKLCFENFECSTVWCSDMELAHDEGHQNVIKTATVFLLLNRYFFKAVSMANACCSLVYCSIVTKLHMEQPIRPNHSPTDCPYLPLPSLINHQYSVPGCISEILLSCCNKTRHLCQV